MKKNLSIGIICFTYCILTSCNTSPKTKSENNIKNEKNIQKDEHSLFDKLLLSSDFPFPQNIDKNNIYTLFDAEENKVYTYQVYIETDGTGTLGWVKYDYNCNILYDISGDIGVLPRILKFDQHKAEKYRESLNVKAQNCPAEKITFLPFEYLSWLDWQTDKDMAIAVENEERYLYYPIENNFRLNYYFNFGQEDTEISAYKYFRLDCNNEFNCYIIEIGYKNIATQYKLITVTNKEVISEILIGDIRENIRTIFDIDENLKIRTRKEHIKYSEEDDENIAFSKEDLSSFQIHPNGTITELK